MSCSKSTPDGTKKKLAESFESTVPGCFLVDMVSPKKVTHLVLDVAVFK